jgi:hypothetical protein
MVAVQNIRREKTLLFVATALAFAMALSCASRPREESVNATSGASAAGMRAALITDSIKPVEGGPRTLVVYYSQGSATRRVAEDLALIFGADVEAIAEKKARLMGFFGYMGAGFQATFGIASRIEAPVRDPADYGRVLILTPVWSWSLSPPVRAWLRLMKGRLPAAGFVTVSGDTKPDKIAAAMARESGATSLAVVGFSERDFLPENRGTYLAKISGFAEKIK